MRGDVVTWSGVRDQVRDASDGDHTWRTARQSSSIREQEISKTKGEEEEKLKS